MQIDPGADILGLVDVQPTFMPGGELPVAGGDAIIPIINNLLTRFDHAFATQDWHPAGHASFASAHPNKQPYDTIGMPYGPQILWPDHAIAGTPNAAIHPSIDQHRIEAIIRKGFHAALDSYSAFFENDRKTPTGLEGWLRQRGFSRLFLCGLATDFCVAWSAEDAARLGFAVTIIEDACRGIGLPEPNGRTTIDTARERLVAMGVAFVNSQDF
ncbi:MAG TPA: bifunctional nicotinamidase/pyrazinamidase [Acetobacteraceae bacterium]|jgi:nicotinamidase/pyrazinamidase|nr:bifunctional nicotinamidase/pyrazinamidase [Acetobacteraceae bacterium]